MKKSRIKEKFVVFFIGLFISILLLEIGLRIGGFTYLSLQEYGNIRAIKQKGEYRILCLGESTTARGWPRSFEEILNQRNIGIKFSIIDKGIPGTNSGALVSRLKNYIDKYKPNMVITMMGINDGENSLILPPSFFDAKKISLKSLKVYRLLILLKQRFEGIRASSSPQKIINTKAIKTIEKAKDYKVEKGNWERIERKDDVISEEEYIRTGTDYIDKRKYNKTEEKFKKALKINPKNERVYLELARCYMRQGKYSQAEEMYKKILTIDPRNYIPYLELGENYRYRGRYDEAEEMLKKALTINPRIDKIYLILGQLYMQENVNKFDKSEKILKKVITMNPKNDQAYFELGWCYILQRRRNKAVKMFEKALAINPENERAYHGLIWCRQYMLMLKYQKEDVKNTFELYHPVAVANYKKLRGILNKENIKLVCVQYPTRSIKSLKKIFENDEEVIFVDNEMLFKNAIKQEGYYAYFKDRCYPDFGHCTEIGNRLLAKNIANVILREYFGK